MRTWKPAAAGVLEIVDGCLQVLSAILLILFGGALSSGGVPERFLDFGLATPAVLAVALVLGVLGIVAIAGGICSLRRRGWGLALAGGICALAPPLSLVPILAIVLVVISKDEFGR